MAIFHSLSRLAITTIQRTWALNKKSLPYLQNLWQDSEATVCALEICSSGFQHFPEET